MSKADIDDIKWLCEKTANERRRGPCGISRSKRGVASVVSIPMKEAWPQITLSFLIKEVWPPLHLSVLMEVWGLCVSPSKVGVASVSGGPKKKL